ncbi:UNVERIFIED_CONTAM: hypothetical protein PYX00_006014 [Menopon gallinae]
MKTVLSICEIGNNDNKARIESNLDTLDTTKSTECHKINRLKGTYTQLRETRIPSGIFQKKYTVDKAIPKSHLALAKGRVEGDTLAKRKTVQFSSAQNISKRGESAEGINTSEYSNYSHYVSHGRTLRPAKEILCDISQYGSENSVHRRMTLWCSSCRRRTYECICRNKCYRKLRECGNEQQESDVPKESFIHQIKPDLQENPVIIELAKKIERKEKEELTKSGDINDKSKFLKKETECSESEPNKRPITAPFKLKESPLEERRTKSEEKTFRTKTKRAELEGIPEEQIKMDDLLRCDVDYLEDKMVIRLAEVASTEGCRPSQDFAPLKQGSDLSDETTLKIAEIIEKNHQKIEDMRRAKVAALTRAKYMKEKYDKLAETKNEIQDKLEKLSERNESLEKDLKEAEETKKKILQELEYLKNIKSMQAHRPDKEIEPCKDTLSENLQDRKWPMIQGDDSGLTGSSMEVCPVKRAASCEHHNLYRRQEAVYKRFVQGLSVLEKVIRNSRAREKRATETKTEVARKRKKILERLNLEKMELLKAVKQLREERRMNMDEIIRKDGELELTKKSLREKCEALEETSKELESIRAKSVLLEDQVRALRKSMENIETIHQSLLKERQSYEELIEKIKGENMDMQERLNNEKDSVLIKNKIIQDQQETIKRLRDKVEEVKNMTKKIESLEKLVSLEREEKLEQQETIERLKRKKEDLKMKVKSLEADLLLAPQEVVRDLQKTQVVLHELENQVQVKQKEWEVILQSLAREKEQACNVAAFATKKLIQTTSDFQRQSDAQKKLYRILTENLVEKKKRSQEGQGKSSPRFNDEAAQESVEVDQLCEDSIFAGRYGYNTRMPNILKKGSA